MQLDFKHLRNRFKTLESQKERLEHEMSEKNRIIKRFEPVQVSNALPTTSNSAVTNDDNKESISAYNQMPPTPNSAHFSDFTTLDDISYETDAFNDTDYCSIYFLNNFLIRSFTKN